MTNPLPLDPHPGVVVVGAGLAGLACARELHGAGVPVTVLERAPGVGGRCATRRVDGRPVDHGLGFLHGSDPAFLDALRDLPGVTVLEGWPHRIHGSGTPCQPDAFAPREQRLAYTEGLTVFPKSLAAALDVRLDTVVTALEPDGDAWVLALGGGARVRARTVVLALATEESLALVDRLPPGDMELEGARHLLRMMAVSVPCLAVLAGYDRGVAPPWDVAYPESSPVLKVALHDSTKRRDAPEAVLVLQASPRWSRAHLADPAGAVAAPLLAEAGRLWGPWAASPRWQQVHAWRHARVESGNELSGPLRVACPGGRTLGITGEVFAEGGGAEAAFTAGRSLALRLLEGGTP